MSSQILSNATKGLVLTIEEIVAASGQVIPSAGPFNVAVTDPNAATGDTVTVIPGSADNTTPTIFRANGTGNTGTISVQVTDTSNNLVGTATFDVVAPPPPPPPPKADTLVVGFTPEP